MTEEEALNTARTFAFLKALCGTLERWRQTPGLRDILGKQKLSAVRQLHQHATQSLERAKLTAPTHRARLALGRERWDAEVKTVVARGRELVEERGVTEGLTKLALEFGAGSCVRLPWDNMGEEGPA